MIGEPTAVASLDALRAAWTVQDELDLSSQGTKQTVLMGASEGGFASLWADRYQPHYLPEADVVAVVAAVPATDLAGLHRAEKSAGHIHRIGQGRGRYAVLASSHIRRVRHLVDHHRHGLGRRRDNHSDGICEHVAHPAFVVLGVPFKHTKLEYRHVGSLSRCFYIIQIWI